MSTDTKPYNKIVETGAFIRTTWKRDKKTHQKTIRIKPNDQKVILGKIGDFEVYIYPFAYPDKVFIGKFPVSTILDSSNVQQLLGVYNKSKWFLANQAYSKGTWRKGANSRRRDIQSSYNNGLKAQISKKKASSAYNYNLDNKVATSKEKLRKKRT